MTGTMRALRPLVLVALLGLSACGGAGVSTSPAQPFSLPESEEMLRGGAVAGTPWLDPPGAPAGFERDAAHVDPSAAANAFIQAARDAYAASPEQPDHQVDSLVEDEGRAVILISETGLADDSVAGVQYLLMLERDGRDWRVDELWTRALCRRGVSGELCV